MYILRKKAVTLHPICARVHTHWAHKRYEIKVKR